MAYTQAIQQFCTKWFKKKIIFFNRIPDGITQLLNLRELYLNDTFLDYLPGNFGR